MPSSHRTATCLILTPQVGPHPGPPPLIPYHERALPLVSVPTKSATKQVPTYRAILTALP